MTEPSYRILFENSQVMPAEVEKFRANSLAYETFNLNLLLERLQLNLVDDFIAQEVLDFDEENPEQEMHATVAADGWFTPEQGIEWVTVLRDYLYNNTSAIRHCQQVLRELENIDHFLQLAARQNTRWRLEIDYT